MRTLATSLFAGVMLFTSIGVVSAEEALKAGDNITVGSRPFSHSEMVAHQERRACEDSQDSESEDSLDQDSSDLQACCGKKNPPTEPKKDDQACCGKKKNPPTQPKKNEQACKECSYDLCKKKPPVPEQACKDCAVDFCKPKDKPPVDLASKIEVNLGTAFSGKQLATYYTSHPGAFHRPLAFGIFGETVELEDGSIWSIYSGHQWATLKWLNTDTIVIVPNTSWFSSYMFHLVNQNTGESVEANLSVGPVYNGIYTHWIVSIDPFFQQIMLEDGSRWDMSSFDSSIYNKWLLNDTIIIGVNNGSFHYSYPNILINVNTLSHAKGKCL